MEKISWKSLVEAAEFHDKPEKEVEYEFSNGAKFYRREDPYSVYSQEEGE